MKNRISIIIFTACGFIVSAQPTFVSTTPANKNAIIELFTTKGIGLPETDSIINCLVSEKQERVFGITIPDYTFSFSLESITNDLSCEAGLSFSNYFNPWSYVDTIKPVGIINRVYANRPQHLENGVNTTLFQSSCLNVAAKGSIDWNLRQLTLTVEVYYTGNSDVSENYLTVALLQNNLEEGDSWVRDNPKQALPNGNYNHLRVLRDIISPTWGDIITETTQGSFFTKTYIYTIPDTIKSTLPIAYINRSTRPEVLLEDLEIIVFVSESRETIITGNKAEITHNNVPKINLRTKLDNFDGLRCNNEFFPLYLTLKNGGSDTIYSIEYNLSQNNQIFIQNQTWDNRPIYPFTIDTITINNTRIENGLETMFSVEITQLNENDTNIIVGNSFIHHFVEDAQGAMTLIIAPDQFASSIRFYIINIDDETNERLVLHNFSNPWTNLSSPGIKEYTYDFLPKKVGCHYLYISDNLNKGFGEGYFKLLAEDGSVLMYNDGKNCGKKLFFINVTVPVGIQEIENKPNVISVYPNPAKDQLRIEMQQAESNTQQVEIYDIYGRKLSAFCLLPAAAEIDISHLAKGMYFLKIGNKTVKFVKE